jgi:hypothetical protein
MNITALRMPGDIASTFLIFFDSGLNMIFFYSGMAIFKSLRCSGQLEEQDRRG